MQGSQLGISTIGTIGTLTTNQSGSTNTNTLTSVGTVNTVDENGIVDTMNSFTTQTDYNIHQKWPFKDYGPHVFRYLRTQIYGISDTEYLESIRPSKIEMPGKVNQKFSERRSG